MMTPEPPSGQQPINPQNAFGGSTPPQGPGPMPGGRPPMLPGGFPPPGYPPAGGYPPPGYGGYPPKQRSFFRRFATVIYTTIAVMIFVGSIVLCFGMLGVVALLGGGVDQLVTEKVINSGDSSSRIALIQVKGVIGDATLKDFTAVMDKVAVDSTVKGVILEVDTPGGTVTASDQMYHLLMQVKQERGFPVVVSMGGLATSGGYYISCGADHLIAQPTTWTGNIGVMMPRYSIAGLADKIGLKDETMHSTGADFKTAGSMMREMTPDENKYLQALLDDASAQFKTVVKNGRGTTLTGDAGEIFSGKVFQATQAKRLGLIDDIGYLDDAISYLMTKVGNPRMEVVRFTAHHSTVEGLLNGQGKLGQASSGGVQINLDKALVDELLSTRPMYMWRAE